MVMEIQAFWEVNISMVKQLWHIWMCRYFNLPRSLSTHWKRSVNPAYFDLTSTSMVRPLRKTSHFCFSSFLTDVDPLIVLLVLFIGLILCLLTLTVFLSQHKSVFMRTHHYYLNKDKCLYTNYYEGHYCPSIIVQ